MCCALFDRGWPGNDPGQVICAGRGWRMVARLTECGWSILYCTPSASGDGIGRTYRFSGSLNEKFLSSPNN